MRLASGRKGQSRLRAGALEESPLERVVGVRLSHVQEERFGKQAAEVGEEGDRPVVGHAVTKWWSEPGKRWLSAWGVAQ